jgi:hypothetical protein
MMKAAAILGFAAAMTALAPAPAQADNSSDALVGKWDCDARRGAKLAMKLLLNYSDSKYFIHRANVAAGDRRGRIDASLTIRGRWRIKGDVLAEQLTSAKMTKFSVNGRDVSQTPFGKLASDSVREDIVGPDSLSNMKIKFHGPNKMRLIDGNFKADCRKR